MFDFDRLLSFKNLSAQFGPVLCGLDWPGAKNEGADMDVAAVAYAHNGTLMDACYFNQRTILSGGIVHQGDSTDGEATYDDEVVLLHLSNLDPNVKFIFIVVTCRSGMDALSGVSLRVVDGSVAGGNQVYRMDLNQASPYTANLAGVFVRPAPALYPPAGWSFHVINQPAQGRNFTECTGLLDQYVAPVVDGVTLAEWAPRNPTAHFNLHKFESYYVDPSIEAAVLGLGWDTHCDVDAHCCVLDENFKVLDHVYYGDRDYDNKNVYHHGDNLTGAGSGDDETMTVRLDKLTLKAQHLAFYVNVYSGASDFSQVKGCYVRMQKDDLDDDLPPFEVCRYALGHGTEGRCRLICTLSRLPSNTGWRLIGLGVPVAGVPKDGQTVPDLLKLIMEGTMPHLVPETEGADIAQMRDMYNRSLPPVPAIYQPCSFRISIDSGEDLAPKDGKTSDPYCKYALFQHKGKTGIIKKNLNPTWNHTVGKDFTICLGNVSGKAAYIEVYDHDRFSADDYMGHAYIHPKELHRICSEGRPQALTLDLQNRTEGKHTVTGSIKVTITPVKK